MPLYDYICENKDCKHEFDYVVIGFNDETPVLCPKCTQVAKKVPSLNARMKQNWSQWNALG
jgi:putative FmdB family regulatory protein